MIDMTTTLKPPLGGETAKGAYPSGQSSHRPTLPHRLLLQMMSHKQDSSSQKGDILASLLHSSRKWRHVHIYVLSVLLMSSF